MKAGPLPIPRKNAKSLLPVTSLLRSPYANSTLLVPKCPPVQNPINTPPIYTNYIIFSVIDLHSLTYGKVVPPRNTRADVFPMRGSISKAFTYIVLTP